MSLAAMGCNPEMKGASIDDIGGQQLGAIGYSESGGLYMAIRANGAVSQYQPCFLAANFDATPKGASSTVGRGIPMVIPQLSLVDNEYGWGLICGAGRVRTDGGVGNNNGFMLASGDEELDTASTGSNVVIAGMVATANDGANDGPMICVFPSGSNSTQ